MRIIRLVSQGESFGDLGELNKRGTNAQAKEICHLLMIRKQYYSNISKVQLKSVGKKRYEFLSSIFLFKLLYRYSLESIIYSLEEKQMAYNQILYREADHLDYVYIVESGEFKLYKKVVSKKQSSNSAKEI